MLKKGSAIYVYDIQNEVSKQTETSSHHIFLVVSQQ